MEAVISGQAGVALLVDGDEVSSIHIHDVDTAIARRAGEFHYLFGGATDLTFVEDVSPERVRRDLVVAVDGQDITQLTLLLLASDRPDEIRETAASELSELIEANADASSFAERLLFSTPLPTDADLVGALQCCGTSPARNFLERLKEAQPFIQRVHEAWRAIPEKYFGTSDEDSRKAADTIFVREGVFRAFVVADAGESSLDSVVITSLQIPAVCSLNNHRGIVTQWKSNLAIDNTSDNRHDVEEMLADDARWEEGEGRNRGKKQRRRSFNRQQELSRVDRVKASIEDAMRDRDLGKARRFTEDLVKEQLAKSGSAFACKSLCNLAKRAQDLGLHGLQLEFTSRAVELENDDGWSWSQHGKALLDNGRSIDALAAYDQAAFFSQSAEVSSGRAETLRSLGRVQDALEAYDAVIQAHPENVVAKTGRAETLRSLGRVQDALEAYDAVIQAHPENVVAKTGRAETLRSLGRVQDALEAYDAVIQAHPENVVATNGRACALVALKRFGEALEALPIESPIESGDWIGFHVRGMCLLKQGRLVEAVEVFQCGVDRCPFPGSRSYFASALAVARIRERNFEDAARVLQDLDSQVQSPTSEIQTGDSPGPLLVRLHVCGVLGRDAEAKNFYQRLPGVLPQTEQDVKEELNHRHILRSGPQHSDDWLFEHLCDCLLAA